MWVLFCVLLQERMRLILKQSVISLDVDEIGDTEA